MLVKASKKTISKCVNFVLLGSVFSFVHYENDDKSVK